MTTFIWTSAEKIDGAWATVTWARDYDRYHFPCSERRAIKIVFWK